MTSGQCRSGTDRVREVARSVSADIYVNVQGDEPMARPEHLDALLSVMKPGVEVGTVYTPCPAEDVNNPNAVKIVTALDGRALYFSRATIPFDRDHRDDLRYFKHLGFYAYTPQALEQFCLWPESELELSERLEQLRFLDHGIDIYAAETPFDTVGVDTEDDLQRVEQLLQRQGRCKNQRTGIQRCGGRQGRNQLGGALPPQVSATSPLPKSAPGPSVQRRHPR